MSDARAEILGRVRANLAADPERGAHTAPLPAVLRGADVPPSERYERFRTTLEKVGGRVTRVPSLAAALARVEALVAERELRKLALSDAAVLAARGWAFSPMRLSGVPVKVVGTITFNFRKS